MKDTLKRTDGKTDHNGHAEGIAHSVSEGLENAKDRVVDGYEKVSDKAHEVWDNVADKNMNDVMYSAQQYVRHHPGTCLLMAAGTGLALGLALQWRRSSRNNGK